MMESGPSSGQRGNDRTASNEGLVDSFLTGLEKVLALVGPARDEILNVQTTHKQGVPMDADTNMNIVYLTNEVEAVREDNARLSYTTEEQHKQLLSIEIDRRNAQSDTNKLSGIVTKYKGDIRSLEDTNTDLKNKLKDYAEKADNNMLELEQAQQEKEKAMEIAHDYGEQNAKLLGENTSLIEEMKTPRLGQMPEHKPSLNVPNADMDTENGLTQVVKLYNNLYTSQWTDALEMCENHFPGVDEQNKIKVLGRIFMKAYDFCKTERDDQVTEIFRLLSHNVQENTQISEQAMKMLNACRRYSADTGISGLVKKFEGKLPEYTTTGKYVKKVPEYLMECLRVCWLMVLQDNPVIVYDEINSGADFDSTVYREYTQGGDKIKYLVWPALLEHEGGHVLVKGVVQCYKSQAYDPKKSIKRSNSKNYSGNTSQRHVKEVETNAGKVHNDNTCDDHEAVTNKEATTSGTTSKQPVDKSVAAAPIDTSGMISDNLKEYPQHLLPSEKELRRYWYNVETHGEAKARTFMGNDTFNKCRDYIVWMNNLPQ